MRKILMVVGAMVAILPGVVFVAPPVARAAGGDIVIDADVDGPEDGSLTFEVRRSGGSSAPLTLSYGTAPVTADGHHAASAGSDYIDISGTTTFGASAGDVIKRFTVRGKPDTLDEYDETFALRFRAGAGVVAEAYGTLDDDDEPPAFTLSAPTGDLPESGAATITATLGALSGKDVTVPFGTSDGSATAVEDYTPQAGRLITIPAGRRGGTGLVPINPDDNDDEDEETFTVTAGSAINAEPGDAVSADVTIADDDAAPTVDIAGDGDAEEGADLTFDVTLSHESNRDVAVGVVTTGDGTATAEDAGPPAPEVVTFARHETGRTATVHANADTLREARESVVVALVDPVNAVLGRATATGHIGDTNAEPAVTLSPTDSGEGDSGTTDAEFGVDLGAASGLPITIGYRVTGNDATAGEDFGPVADGVLSFAPGETHRAITVPIIGDTVHEGDETFKITLSAPGGGVSGLPGPVKITIRDDDGPPGLAALGDVSRAEGGDVARLVVTLTNPSARAVTLDVTTRDGTATTSGGGPGAIDFVAPARTLVIPAGATTAEIPVTIKGDTVWEGDETAGITVATRDGDPDVSGGSLDATLTIGNDDDPPVITVAPVTGREGDTVRLGATVAGEAQAALDYDVTLTPEDDGDDPAATPVADFDAPDVAAGGTITPGRHVLDLGAVDLLDDAIDEFDQSIKVTVTPYETGVAEASGWVTIEDAPEDLAPAVTIDAPAAVDENAGVAVVRVSMDYAAVPGNRATQSEKYIAVDYATTPGTAEEDADFAPEAGTVHLRDSIFPYRDIAVPILDDGEYEGGESFDVTLSDPVPADTRLVRDRTTVTIADDDWGDRGGFSVPAAVTVDEGGGPAAVTVTLDRPAPDPVDLEVTATPGTAGTDDYRAPGTPLRIEKGQESGFVRLPVVDDAAYEGDETVTVTVAPLGSSLPPEGPGTGGGTAEGDIVGGPQETTVTIVDDDPLPSLIVRPAAGGEGGAVTLTARVVGQAQADLPLTVTATGASRTPGAAAAGDGDFDASALAAGATLPAGPHPDPIDLGTIQLASDTVDEDPETVRIDVGGLTPAPRPGWLTIADDPDDLTPGVTVDDTVADEAGGAAHVPVTLDFAAGGPNGADRTERRLSFDYTTEDGTATRSGDYAATVGTVVFGDPDVRTGYIEVPIRDDARFEGEETFGIRIAGGRPATVTVVDDETPPTITLNTATAGEGGRIDVIATVTGVAERDLTYELTMAGDAAEGEDAVEPEDYADSGAAATIPGGTPSGTAVTLRSFGANPDRIDEPVETVRVTVRNDTTDVSALYRIADDPADRPPAVDVGAVGVTEGDVAQVPVRLRFAGGTNGATSTEQPVTVAYAVAPGTATAADLGAAPPGPLVIAPGEPGGVIELPTAQDQLVEPDETCTVRITAVGPAGAAIGTGTGTVTIADDEVADGPTLDPPATLAGAGTATLTGTAAPGAAVALLAAPGADGGTPSQVATTVASAKGAYTFRRAFGTGYRVQARAGGRLSPVRLVQIQQSPVLALSSPLARSVTATVTGNPRTAGQEVELQRASGGVWTAVATGTLGAAGTFVTMLRNLPSGASQSYRAVIAETPAQVILAGTSPAKAVTVK